MEAFARLVRALSLAAGLVAAGLLAAAVVVVCQMVFIRYLLGSSTVWQTEFVTYALVATTFLGSPYVLALKGHVMVDLLPLYLGRRGRFLLAVLANLLTLLFCLALFWQAAFYWTETWVEGWTTDTVWALPLWIPVLPLPVGAFLLLLQLAADLGLLLSGRAEPFGKAGSSAL